jgi:3-deoxy-D-manno-octulosonic-acid transferase
MIARLLYGLGWWLATPLVIAYLLSRAWRQPEYLQGWAWRWGLHPRRRDAAPLIWVHAVSVGETRAAQPLIDALLARDPALRVLLTHMTPTGMATGRELFAARHGARVVQALLPYDYAFAMRRFLRAWRPCAGLVMETELWPNLCAAARRAGVPLALVNARLSPRSLRRGLRWQALIGPATASLSCVVAQTEEDAQRIRRIAPVTVHVAGNLKFDVTVDPRRVERGRGWRERFASRAVVLAASTRDGEEALLLQAWNRRLRGDSRSALEGVAQARDGAPALGAVGAAPAPVHAHEGVAPLLVLVPRHPQRFDEVAALIESYGLRCARRSLQDPAELDPSSIDVLLGDSMGEMFVYYGMADVAIIGGSLLPFGGQNLIEACAAGVPVVLGRHTYNFAEAAEEAIAAGAASRVDDAEAALAAACALADDAPGLAQQARCALEFAHAHRGATRRTLEILAPLLEGCGGPVRGAGS